MENPEDIEDFLLRHWPNLFGQTNENLKNSLRLTKISQRNWLINKSNGNETFILKNSSNGETNLDFELNYLMDLNEYFHGEYRVPIPIRTYEGLNHVNSKYWLYEFICGHVYSDNETSNHLFDEKQLISLAKILSKYHQFLITHSPSFANQKRTTTREHLIQELKQAGESICPSTPTPTPPTTSSSSSSSSTIIVSLPRLTSSMSTCPNPLLTSPIPTSTTTTSSVDVVNEYFLHCYPLLCRLLRESLSRYEKSHPNRTYPIHRNIRPSKVIWSDQNQVIGLLDFENVNHDSLWRDLAVCLSTFCTSSSPSIITDVDRMRIFIEEYMKQMSGGTARVSSQTEQEVFQLIVDEIILCAIEDFTFIYWQFIHQNDKFQGLKAMEFYYKRALWHAEHALRK